MRPERVTKWEVVNTPTGESVPYEEVRPYSTCESALRLVCHIIRAVDVLTETVSVLETASAGADGVVVAVSVSVAEDVVVAVVVDVPVSVVDSSGSGSGSGVASVVKVPSPVIAALPPESMTITR